MTTASTCCSEWSFRPERRERTESIGRERERDDCCQIEAQTREQTWWAVVRVACHRFRGPPLAPPLAPPQAPPLAPPQALLATAQLSAVTTPKAGEKAVVRPVVAASAPAVRAEAPVWLNAAQTASKRKDFRRKLCEPNSAKPLPQVKTTTESGVSSGVKRSDEKRPQITPHI